MLDGWRLGLGYFSCMPGECLHICREEREERGERREERGERREVSV